ncbi:hypothetical protein ATK36_5430 [Amycolatopsis sulphurea]|uniref:Uncharacterized protein n=1 Tax=Amycolatopsis sulphurea TaxID=76022 RepID=A0A2A9FFI7_9PSEU|nr:hypothetical protein ATK36_5430 [Amycolatopsis sulphurea]
MAPRLPIGLRNGSAHVQQLRGARSRQLSRSRLSGTRRRVPLLAAALFVLGASVRRGDEHCRGARRTQYGPGCDADIARGVQLRRTRWSLLAGLAAGQGWSPARHLTTGAAVTLVVLVVGLRAAPDGRPAMRLGNRRPRVRRSDARSCDCLLRWRCARLSPKERAPIGLHCSWLRCTASARVRPRSRTPASPWRWRFREPWARGFRSGSARRVPWPLVPVSPH